MATPALARAAPAPRPAPASSAELTRAKKLFERADDLYREQKFEEALALFVKARKALPKTQTAKILSIEATLLYNIAQCYRMLADSKGWPPYLGKAIFYYRLFRASAHVSQGHRDGASALIKVLRAKRKTCGQLSVVSQPASATVTVRWEGSQSTKTSPVLLTLFPGVAQVTVRLAGHREVTRSVRVKTGETTVVDVKMVRLAPRRRRVVAPPPKRLPEPTPALRPFYRRWWFWTGVGLTAGLVVAGAITGGQVLSMKSEWEREQGLVADPDGFESRFKSYRLAADLLLLGAALTAAGTVVGAILVGKGRREKPRALVTPSCYRGGCGMWVQGRF